MKNLIADFFQNVLIFTRSNIKVIQTVWNVTLKIRSQYRNEWRENEFMLYLTEQNIRERYNIYRIRKKKKKKNGICYIENFL